MVFDEFHDPHPPEPGMREFATRRRAGPGHPASPGGLGDPRGQRRAPRSVPVLAVHQVSEPTRDHVRRARPSRPDPPNHPVGHPTPSDTGSTLSLAGAQSASALPPIALGPGLLTISDDPLVEIFEATDGSTCTQAEVVVTTPNCAPAGTGFVVIGYGEGDGTRVAIVVDPTVNVSFDDPDAACTQNFPDFAVVQVWVCAGLTADAATVEIAASDRIVIHN